MATSSPSATRSLAYLSKIAAWLLARECCCGAFCDLLGDAVADDAWVEDDAEEEDVEEETFVLVDLPTVVPMLPGETLRFERLDTDAPVLKTSTGKTYEGYYERTIGEALLVEPADKSCVSYENPRSGKKRVVLKANGEEEEEEESGDGANVRAATEVRLKFRKPVEKM